MGSHSHDSGKQVHDGDIGAVNRSPSVIFRRVIALRFDKPRTQRIARISTFSAATVAASLMVFGNFHTVFASSTAQRNTTFERTATYPIYENRPAGADPASATAAEISTVTRDGKTLIYTDATGKRIGFIDISDPGTPKGLGTLSVVVSGDVESEPTSVAVVGEYALVVVNTSKSFTEPSGRVDVIRVATRERVRSIDLGGQPDSIAISKDQKYAAIAIENERDEEAVPAAGGAEGDLPQPPVGFLQILDLPGENPDTWSNRRVSLTAEDGGALSVIADAGLAAPADPEPEYVSINKKNKIAITLQENNGVVVVDARTGKVVKAFSAGANTVTGIDTKNDTTVNQTGSITDVPREPDAISWVDDRYLATANEGDWKGGSRGWTIFDSVTGNVVWDAGNSLEQLAVRFGLHNEARAGKKGVEPEGITIADFKGVRCAFVGVERSNYVAVYDLSRSTRPVFRQILAIGGGPEGLLAIPGRNMLAVSSETDDASVGVRSSISLFQITGVTTPSFPTLVSGNDSQGQPIGWGALGALSAVPGQPGLLYTVTDARYKPTRILTVDTRRMPATITTELVVKDAAGNPVGYDAEGIHARAQGGFWLVSEGATGAANTLVLLDANGVTQQVIPLPADVASGLADQGLHGVTAITDRTGKEQVWVTLRGAVADDPAGVVRLGRFDVTTGKWAWFGYRLESNTAATRTGLAEITVVAPNKLAVIERDCLNGPAAKVKRIYTVAIPSTTPAAGTLPPLTKSLAYDVLPDLRATKGWTQEKLEGLTIGADGFVYAITDNDGLVNATGETVLLRLGRAERVFKTS